MKKFNSWLETTHKLSAEDFEAKTAEEKAELFTKYNEYLNDEHKKATEDATKSKEDLEKLSKEFSAFKENVINGQLETLNKALKAQGIELKRLKDGEASRAKESLSSQIEKELKVNLEGLKALKDKRNAGSVSFKVVGDITSANISGGNIPVEQRLPGMEVLPTREIRLLDLVTRGTASSNLISWVDQANKEGATGQTAEGVLKNQIDFDFVVRNESLKKTTAFIKISTEMLEDVSFVRSEINKELMTEMILAIENQVYDGDNTGENHNGIRTQATAFAAGTHALAVDNANEVDVLAVAMEQIFLAHQKRPNAVLVHPSMVTSLLLEKQSATDKRYIERLVQVGSSLMIDGVPIIQTTLVTADEYLVGAFDLAQLWSKGGVSIEIGRDSDDFTKNMVTILAEFRGLTVVKTNHLTAFVKGVFATDKAALETV